MSARHTAARVRVPGRLGLTLRQVLADPWVSVALAVLVVLVTGIATLWPRAVLDIDTRQVEHEVDQLSAQQSDVTGTTSLDAVPTGEQAMASTPTVDGSWGPFIDALERIRSQQPEPLRSLLGEARFYADVGQESELEIDPDAPVAAIDLQLRVDPYLRDYVRLVDGAWPAPAPPPRPAQAGDGPAQQRAPLEVAINQGASERLSWEVGEVRSGSVLLAGTYEALDPDDPHWEHSVNGAVTGEVYNPNIGYTAQLVGYLDPASLGLVAAATDGAAVVPDTSIDLWYPLEGAAVRGDQVGLLTAQLNRLTSADVVLREKREVTDPEGGQGTVPETTLRLATEVSDTFVALAQQQRASAAILAVVAAGPVGVTIAVFALGARLIVHRRRGSLALARARGASDTQVRTVLGLEGVAIGVPAALLGYAAADLLLPASTGWGEWVVAGLVAVVPAGALVLGAGSSGRSLLEQRQDLGASGRSRLRWITETAILALAAVAVWRLLSRGLTGAQLPASGGEGADRAGTDPAGVQTAADTGVDLLMAATPVLLALAACVLTLRLYPLPVRALATRFRRGSGLTAFLGAARSVRDPAAGLVPALAVILGVSVATFSAIMVSTITNGAQDAAWGSTGASVRVSGPRMSEDLMETIRSTDGVQDAAAVGEAPASTELVSSGSADQRDRVTVDVLDPDLLPVQQSAPRVEALPDELFDASAEADAIPVVTGGDVEISEGRATLSGTGTVQVVGHVDALPGVRTDRNFVLVDRTAWEAAGGSTTPGNVALVSVTEGADRQQVAAALADAVPDSLVEVPDDRLDAFRAAPVVDGLQQLVLAAVLLTTVLTVVAVLVVQLTGAPARARLLAVLRTLGLRPGQGRALTAWELGPLLVTALLVGGVVGLTVPWLLVQAIDLTGMTGGADQPEVAIDPLAIGLLAIGVLLTVGLAVTVSAAIAGRTNLAQQLRVGEER